MGSAGEFTTYSADPLVGCGGERPLGPSYPPRHLRPFASYFPPPTQIPDFLIREYTLCTPCQKILATPWCITSITQN